MRDCDKWCMANVGGKCAVRDCRGEIRRLAKAETDAVKAAEFYEFSAKVFDSFENEDDEDDDGEDNA